MGKEARVALLLAATGCLLAVMVDYIIDELTAEQAAAGSLAQPTRAVLLTQ